MPAEAPLFARQPIFDVHNMVVAYELLFRHSDANYVSNVDGDHASSNVLLEVFGSHKIDDVIGEKKAFINFTRNLLLNPPPLPKAKTVIEVLEDVPADEEVLLALKQLRRNGYSLALDDFFINRNTQKMLRYANIIKVDVLALSQPELEKYVKLLKPLNKTLLAEKIEDHQMLEQCKSLGFELFQGYFLCKPEIVRGVKTDVNRSSILRLISSLNNEKSKHNELVDIISSDSGLSYKILKMVNSPAIGLGTNIQSLSQSITMLGLDKIRSWASFILMANNNSKPRELSVITLCRAKLCEFLGTQAKDQAFGQTCFTIGLLSNLDSFLNLSMDELINELKLASNIEAALLHEAGLEGSFLKIVRRYERGDWQSVDWKTLEQHKIEAAELNTAYINSIAWAIQLTKSSVTE